MTTAPSLPYRSMYGDNFDVMTSAILRAFYFHSPTMRYEESIKKAFDEFTQNLMTEKSLNRFCVLDAIKDFIQPCDPQHSSNCAWQHFEALVFNCRPYQGGYSGEYKLALETLGEEDSLIK